MPRPNSVGSKPGRLTSASTSPLFGSSATTAPRCPASAASATRCTFRSIDSTRSSPGVGGLVRRFGTKAPWRSTERPCAFTSTSRKPLVPCSSRLVGALDAELADERGAGVGGAVDVLEVLLADGAHVAERVHGQSAVRVPARLARLDVQARELEAAHGEARHVLVGHAQADRHAVEAAAGVDGALELVDVLGADQSELHQARQRPVDVRHLLGHQLELVGGLVAGDHLAVRGRGSGRAPPGSARCARGCPGRARRSSRGGSPAARTGARSGRRSPAP